MAYGIGRNIALLKWEINEVQYEYAIRELYIFWYFVYNMKIIFQNTKYNIRSTFKFKTQYKHENFRHF